jgi:hypothetical protein
MVVNFFVHAQPVGLTPEAIQGKWSAGTTFVLGLGGMLILAGERRLGRITPTQHLFTKRRLFRMVKIIKESLDQNPNNLVSILDYGLKGRSDLKRKCIIVTYNRRIDTLLALSSVANILGAISIGSEDWIINVKHNENNVLDPSNLIHVEEANINSYDSSYSDPEFVQHILINKRPALTFCENGGHGKRLFVHSMNYCTSRCVNTDIDNDCLIYLPIWSVVVDLGIIICGTIIGLLTYKGINLITIGIQTTRNLLTNGTANDGPVGMIPIGKKNSLRINSSSIIKIIPGINHASSMYGDLVMWCWGILLCGSMLLRQVNWFFTNWDIYYAGSLIKDTELVWISIAKLILLSLSAIYGLAMIIRCEWSLRNMHYYRHEVNRAKHARVIYNDNTDRTTSTIVIKSLDCHHEFHNFIFCTHTFLPLLALSCVIFSIACRILILYSLPMEANICRMTTKIISIILLHLAAERTTTGTGIAYDAIVGYGLTCGLMPAVLI